jgi:type I restriction enzyme S subunit
MTQELLGNHQVAVPPPAEQRQIARFLDYETARIDALIEKQQQLIALLKEKRQAVISHAVTEGLNPNAPLRDSGVEWLGMVPAHWGISRLKHTSKVVDCRNKTPEYFAEGEYFVIRTTNVKNKTLQLDGDCLRTDRRNFEIWTQRGVPVPGSILFTREAPAGEVCLVPTGKPICMGQRMMNFIPASEHYTPYLFAYLMSDWLARYIESVSLGSTVSHLRVDQVENIPVPVPPDSEAVKIAEHVAMMRARMGSIIAAGEAQIELLQERRTAVISAAVTGKIDVRNWTPPESKPERDVA